MVDHAYTPTYINASHDKRSRHINSRIISVTIIIGLACIGYLVYLRTNDTRDNTLTVVDIDGNEYRTIKIGNQTWMAENLRTTKLNDGQNIQYASTKNDWAQLFAPGYCWPDNDTSNKQDYGALYNWYAVNTGKLAPKGWHVATEEEWSILVTYLGGPNLAGGNLKKMNFTVRFAGVRAYNGVFGYIGEMEKYWTSTEGGWHSGDAWYYTVARLESVAERSSHMKMDGQSVRCIKDP